MFDGKRGWRAGGWRRLTGIRVRGRHRVGKRDEKEGEAERTRDRVSFRGESCERVSTHKRQRCEHERDDDELAGDDGDEKEEKVTRAA
ncbi:hypothetical protein ALC62_07976 [Cyphomyrmex costatus]|uniref:Uncharacterized protein n=1 Tax=Cyphomyrmex costatus TaxID=456900 RepID=A0A195CLJ9_9HYME|nr:hypothetical protein ALC62_07976 [Cyphomyrmex costatus]